MKKFTIALTMLALLAACGNSDEEQKQEEVQKEEVKKEAEETADDLFGDLEDEEFGEEGDSTEN